MTTPDAMEQSLIQSVIDAATEHLGYTRTAAALLPITGRPGQFVVMGELEHIKRLLELPVK